MLCIIYFSAGKWHRNSDDCLSRGLINKLTSLIPSSLIVTDALQIIADIRLYSFLFYLHLCWSVPWYRGFVKNNTTDADGTTNLTSILQLNDLVDYSMSSMIIIIISRLNL